MMSPFVELVLRWLHVGSAVVLTGGLFFLAVIWIPAMRGQPGGATAAFEPLRSAWARTVGICTLLLLGTGL
ncbi:MAG TPA: hypothetical protein VIY86_11165, partial [Pirellulaceae bacterium]